MTNTFSELDEQFILNNKCLTNYEASVLLSKSKSNDTNVIKAQKYSDEFKHITNETQLLNIKKCLEGLDDFEIVTLINLMPHDVEVAKAVCPTLSKRSDEEIEQHLRSLRQYASG